MLNLPVQMSEDEDIENVTYNGWLLEHFVSSVLIFSPEGEWLEFLLAPQLTSDCRADNHCQLKCTRKLA